MRSYTDITPEDRALIVISVNYFMSLKGGGNDELCQILTDMFSKHPKLSLFDIPLICPILEDFYRSVINEQHEHHLRLPDRDVLHELQSNCKKLIEKLTETAQKHNLALGRPS